MKILFTGASSFTGYWFVRALTAAGHGVTAVLRRPVEQYEGVRGERIARVAEMCRTACCAFGDERFLHLLRQEKWDLLCHHAAEVTNYKSADFDVAAALRNNTRELPAVLDALQSAGCNRMVVTGSLFENGEGAGSEGLPAFSPYGLSKYLTAETLRYYTAARGMHLGKFVIPNPFGPHEEPRFTTYLARSWLAGQTPAVNTPAYVRDNIHVSLLAKAYARFAGGLPARSGFRRINPCGYIESQGAFAERFSKELSPRLGIACPIDLKRQAGFTEPRIRINTDMPDAQALGWDEPAAWDELAEYYRQLR